MIIIVAGYIMENGNRRDRYEFRANTPTYDRDSFNCLILKTILLETIYLKSWHFNGFTLKYFFSNYFTL